MSRKLVTWIAVVALCATLAWVCRAIWRAPGNTFSQNNPDGLITIENVTFGRPSPYFFGPKKDRLLYRVLPEALREPLKPGTRLGNSATLIERIRMRATREMAFCDPGTNEIAFWLSMNRPPQGWIMPLTEDGMPFGLGALIPYATTPLASQTIAFFPRREKELRLRFYGLKGKLPNFEVVQLGNDFTISNPAYRRYTKWKADRGPATVEDGLDRFELSQLVTRIESDRFNTPDGRYSTMAVFKTSRDTKRRLWRPDSIRMSDATGNSYAPSGLNHSWRTTSQYEETSLTFPGALDPSEAVRVSVTFAPQDKLGAESIWKTSQFILPESGRRLAILETENFGGTVIELNGISGQSLPEGLQPPMKNCWLHVRAVPRQPHDPLLRLCLLEAKGPDGNDFLTRPSSTSLQSQEASLQFSHPRETRKASFTLALQHAKTLTFTILPTDARSQKSAMTVHP
jgi:hypothetical protein